MNLAQFIKALQVLEAAGHGTKPVFYRHGASGDCGSLGSPRVSNEVNDCGPYDLDEGAEYVAVYAGN